jgi:hypothetical protein
MRRCATGLCAAFASVLIGCALGAKRPAHDDPWFKEFRVPSGGRSPFAAALADFTGDGRIDIAVTNVGSENVSLVRYSDGGDSQAEAWFHIGPVARGIEASDFNGDGRPDVAVAAASAGRAYVFLNGDEKPVGYRAGLFPFMLAVGDLNANGHADVVVANETNILNGEGKGTVSVLYGRGDGQFSNQVVLRCGTHPVDVELADFNRDGVTDIASLNWLSRDICLFLGDGEGRFESPVVVPYGGAPAYSLAAVDVNRDQAVDLIVGDAEGAIRLLHNDGTGGLALAKTLRAGRGLRSLSVVDLNEDGWADIATANTAENTVSILLAAKLPGEFLPAHTIPVGKLPRYVAAADLNQDGKIDLVVTNSASNDLSILMSRL